MLQATSFFPLFLIYNLVLDADRVDMPCEKKGAF
jgi:hypothetical protein